MSITPPEGYVYGTVVGRFLEDALDTADVDRYPDVLPSIGSVTFTPKVPYYKNLILPATFISKAVPATLDAAGFLRDSQGNAGVVLIDSTSPGISPSGWPYTVSMTISGKTLPSFDIHVVGGETIDLTTVMPAATSASTVVIVSEAARIAAESARDEVVAIRDDLIENPPGGGLDTEAVQDLVGAMAAGTNGYVTTTYNDGAGTLTIASTSALGTDLAAKAPLNSPAFTGSPTAPTPTAGDNDTSIATTAFVTTAVAGATIADASETVKGKVELATTAETTTGTDTTRAVTPAGVKAVADTKAPLASPALTGNPTAPTPTAGDNDTSIATTAFVTGGISTAVGTKSDKTASAAFRVKSGSTDVGAGPGWPVRPTGYVTVVAIGADPSPTDSVAGDVRWIPAA